MAAEGRPASWLQPSSPVHNERRYTNRPTAVSAFMWTRARDAWRSSMTVLLRPSAVPPLLVTVAVLACGPERVGETAAASDSSRAESAKDQPQAAVQQEEPKQWTPKEVAKRLSDGGLVVTDSGRTSVRHSFLAVEGRQLRVSGSDLQIFIYPDPGLRKADSDRIDTARVAPADAIIDWVATPHLIASGNLIAIHLTPNERLAERVRLILEAWHAGS